MPCAQATVAQVMLLGCGPVLVCIHLLEFAASPHWMLGSDKPDKLIFDLQLPHHLLQEGIAVSELVGTGRLAVLLAAGL